MLNHQKPTLDTANLRTAHKIMQLFICGVNQVPRSHDGLRFIEQHESNFKH